MRYTIGNNNPGPSNPSHASQLFAQTQTNVGKFTAHDAVADTSTNLSWDLAFNKSYIVRQTQKGGGAGGVKHGFVDRSSGSKIGTWGHDQDAPASITRAQFDAAGGDVDWRADYLKAGDYTFQGGAG